MNAKITAAELHTINVLDSNYLLDALGGGFSPPASWQECFGTLELIVMKSDWAMPIWTLPERQPPQICWDHQILLMKTMVMMLLLLMMMMMRRRRRTGRRTFSSSGLKGDVAMIILLVNCGLYLAKGSKATKKMKSGDMAIAEYSHFRWLHSFWSHQEPRYHPARTPRFGVLQFGPKVHRNFDAIDDMNRALRCIRLWAANFVAKIHHSQIQWIYQKGALAI